MCRDRVRKVGVHLQLILARNVKDSKNSFFKFSSRKRRKSVGPPVIRTGDLVKKDMEQAKVFSTFFALFFPHKICLQGSQASDISGNIWSTNNLLMVEANKSREHLNRRGIRKSMRPDAVRPWC